MFEETDWEVLMSHQKLFMSGLFGGPCDYAGENIRTTHCSVNNGKHPYQIHFKAVVENVIDTLEDLHVSMKDIKEVRKILLSMKNNILGYDKDKKGWQNKQSRKSREFLKLGKVEHKGCKHTSISPRASLSKGKLFVFDVEGKARSIASSCSRRSSVISSAKYSLKDGQTFTDTESSHVPITSTFKSRGGEIQFTNEACVLKGEVDDIPCICVPKDIPKKH